MAHIAERKVSHYQRRRVGYEVTVVSRPRDVASYLPQVRPEIVFAVPRVWEKVRRCAGVQPSSPPTPRRELEEAFEPAGDGRRQRA